MHTIIHEPTLNLTFIYYFSSFTFISKVTAEEPVVVVVVAVAVVVAGAVALLVTTVVTTTGRLTVAIGEGTVGVWCQCEI